MYTSPLPVETKTPRESQMRADLILAEGVNERKRKKTSVTIHSPSLVLLINVYKSAQWRLNTNIKKK